MPPLVVGFDLDMTLVDSADGIVAAVLHVVREHGAQADAAAIRETLGLPLDAVFPRWLPDVPYPQALAAYRAHYRAFGVPRTTLLPGAAAAVDAVHAQGGRVVVVSAKHEPVVHEVLAVVGLRADAVAGELFGPAKAAALRALGAGIYVGDHPGDVAGARRAGAVAVAVPTGPSTADQLRAAGADVVLEDLRAFPDWLEAWTLPARLDRLRDRLRSLGSVLVAFSGGVDSALLLAEAVAVLGPQRVVAATAVSPSLAGPELPAAAALAARLGVRHLTPTTAELRRPGYQANGADRCAHCKAELMHVLAPLARELGLSVVATGTNADDVRDGFRPGIAAAAAAGAVTPLADAGLTKAAVRAAARSLGLPVWAKPQAACLASRIAYGIAITPSRLARVDRAETALRAALVAAGIPVTNLRVRDLGDRARVEVDAALVPRVRSWALLPEVLADAGFASVELDPRGFRSGSMNEALVSAAGRSPVAAEPVEVSAHAVAAGPSRAQESEHDQEQADAGQHGQEPQRGRQLQGGHDQGEQGHQREADADRGDDDAGPQQPVAGRGSGGGVGGISGIGGHGDRVGARGWDGTRDEG